MFLAIVRKVQVGDRYRWEIDEDSSHVFDDEGGDYPIKEIRVAGIRSVTESKEKATSKG